MSKAKKRIVPGEVEFEAGEIGPGPGYVKISGRGGLATYFFPWDVLKIEQGTEAGRGTIYLARDGAQAKVAYEETEPEQIAGDVWAAMQRGAATMLLDQVHQEGASQVIEGIVGLVEPRMTQWLGDARSDEIGKLVTKHVVEALKALADKRRRPPPT